jgi:hypothetical protein
MKKTKKTKKKKKKRRSKATRRCMDVDGTCISKSMVLNKFRKHTCPDDLPQL